MVNTFTTYGKRVFNQWNKPSVHLSLINPLRFFPYPSVTLFLFHSFFLSYIHFFSFLFFSFRYKLYLCTQKGTKVYS